jgi:hypothetical protein
MTAAHTPHEELTRTGRFVRGHLPMVAVALVMLAALVLVVQDRWRRGAGVLGAAVLLGAVFRLVLPEARVGLLAVRGRGFDVTAMAAVGSAIIALTATIASLGTG